MIDFDHLPREIHRVDEFILVIYNWSNLSETSKPKIWENVELFNRAGERLWTVNGMSKCRYWDKNIDVFVGARVKGGKFQLTSYSGNSYDVDLKNGAVVFAEFHK